VSLIAAGDEPTADQLNNVLVAVKGAGQIVNNSATLVNDSDLLMPVSANTTYAWRVMLLFTSATTPDIKYAMAFPTGATCPWFSVRLLTTASPTGDVDMGGYSAPTSGVSVAGAAGTGGVQGALIFGSLIVGSTAGTLQTMWAQLTANASDTTVHAGSHIVLERQP
jgi:hypothetical protein